jgi:hypothetical protein
MCQRGCKNEMKDSENNRFYLVSVFLARLRKTMKISLKVTRPLSEICLTRDYLLEVLGFLVCMYVYLVNERLERTAF